MPTSALGVKFRLVDLSKGTVRGRASDGVLSFKGIPFAMPPVGDLRFGPPLPSGPWSGERDCTEDGPISLQHLDPLSAMIPGCEWRATFIIPLR
jgi:para-nitrobenzyl esterase